MTRGRQTLTLDMTPDGRIRPAAPAGLTWPLKLGLASALVAVVALLGIAAAVMVWLVSVLLPIAVFAGAIAYVAFRVQGWRSRQGRKHLLF